MDPEGNTEALISSSSDSSLSSCAGHERTGIVDSEPQLPLMICTAIPYDATTRRSSSIGSLTMEDEGLVKPSFAVPLFSIKRYQTLGFLAGLVIGSFIQLSSLGANYLLTELYKDGSSGAYDMDTHDQGRTVHVLGFSLLWSLLTSLMGVMVLLILRSLVIMAASGPKHEASPTKTTLLLHLETYFAVGTLVGVCLSWTCTDVWMGLPAHSLQSLLTLVAALVWCKLVSKCCFASNREEEEATMTTRHEPNTMDEEADSYSPSRPLMSDEMEDEDDEDAPFMLDLKLVKYETLVLGILIGFYIQFSSLGANFLLNDYKSDASATYLLLWAIDIPQDHKSALVFSFFWSMVTSGMGICLLLIVRSLVKAAYKSRMQDVSSAALLQDVILQLEGGFAVGALVGVNVSWIMTDLMLNLQVQYMHSIVTFALALVWCKSVSMCLVKSKVYHEDEEVEDDMTRPLLVHT